MRAVFAAGVTVICAVAALVLPASAAEVRDGRIAFDGYNPGADTYDLFSSLPNGSDRINLTRHFGADARGPVYSPDGRWIAFGCAELGDKHRPIPTDVCVVEDAVKNPKPVRLTGMKGYDFPWAFSPDSKRILFTAGKKNDSVYVMRRDGTGITRLTDPDMDAESPTYTPDGKRIVFDSYEGHLTGGLYLMDADGSNLASITDRSVFTWAYGPSMSPDGKHVAFLAYPVGDDDDTELFLSDLQGGNVVRLTSDNFDQGYPAFSPDGDLIAYVAGAHRLIWTVRPDGTHNEVSVDTGAYNLESFAWAPSGDRLAVEMDHQSSDIGTAAPGESPHRITQGGIKEESPAWAVKR